jgi:AcrR family transcriptional regulator
MPKRVDQEERRQRIASALMDVAAAEGLEGVSLRHVAAQAGVTSGMVQHYFPSKDAMIGFAMRTAIARYAARIEAALASLGSAPEAGAAVTAVLTTLLPHSDEERRDAQVAVAFQSYAASHPEAADELGRDNALLRAFLAEQLSLRAGDRTTTIDCERAAVALLAMTDGLAIHVVCARLPVKTATAALHAQIATTLAAIAPS